MSGSWRDEDGRERPGISESAAQLLSVMCNENGTVVYGYLAAVLDWYSR